MIKKITTVLHSPLKYEYMCTFMYNYIKNKDNKEMKTNGTFYIGNPKTSPHEACVTISVFFPDKDKLVDSSIASLILVKHSESCSEHRPLGRGDGTVDMLNTAMSFVIQVCPFIKEFKFNDASTTKCDNGSTITLPYYNMTKRQKTWYEEKFNAYLKAPLESEYKRKMKDTMSTPLPSFTVFIQNHTNASTTSKVIINELQTVYVEGDTVKTFFDTLYKKYGNNMGCIIILPWIDVFMRNVGLHKYVANADWYISAASVEKYPFKRNITNMYKVNTYNNTRKRNAWNK